MQLLKPLADKGNADAQEKIGRLYERGKGLPKDFTQAEYWYRKAAEQGDPAAQARLGFMYRIGEGVTRDPKQAAKWYAMGATKGNPLAQVGWSWRWKASARRPIDAAAGWFDKAANQGDASAMLALAALYERGKGVAKSDVQALKWTILATYDDGEYEQELFDRAKLRGLREIRPPGRRGRAEAKVKQCAGPRYVGRAPAS